MSFSCWGIVGYGIRVKKLNLFDPTKIASLFEIEIPDELQGEEQEQIWFFLSEYYDIDLTSILTELAKKSNLLQAKETGQMDDGVYLYFPALLPWEMPKHYLNFSKQDIQDELIEVLLPYVSDSFNRELLKEHIKEISSAGVLNEG